jgi:putative membrane protein
MKKKLFLPVLIAASVLTACNDDGDTTATSTTTDSSTVSSTTDNTMTGDTSMNSTANAAPLSEMDREFIMKAAMGGKMEVEAGNLSQSNAAHERVKAFGAMMVRDHSQANTELMGIAQAHGFMAPDSVDKKMADHMAQMQKMQGKAFDKHYMDMMVNDHTKTIADFEKAANGATAPDVKAFAAKTLPILKMHKDSATAINKAVKM